MLNSMKGGCGRKSFLQQCLSVCKEAFETVDRSANEINLGDVVFTCESFDGFEGLGVDQSALGYIVAIVKFQTRVRDPKRRDTLHIPKV